MCCDLCDLYENCQEVVTPEEFCCSECAEAAECRGDATAGRHMMDDEEFDSAPEETDDDDYDDDYEDDDDDDYDDFGDDDYDYDDDDDYESRH